MMSRSRTPSPSASGASGPPPKRARSSRMKACDRCMAGKLRCEDIRPAGCGRCRNRKDGSVCSLAYADTTAHSAMGDHEAPKGFVHDRNVSASHVHELQDQQFRIQALSNKVDWLEQQLAHVHAQGQAQTRSGALGTTQTSSSNAHTTPSSSLVPCSHSAPRESALPPSYGPWQTLLPPEDQPSTKSKYRAAWRASWYNLVDNPHAIAPEFGQARFHFSPMAPRRPSPIQTGLASEVEYEVAFLRVHRDVPRLLPLYPLNTLLFRQPSDADPLAILSVLVQSPSARPELFDTLDEMSLTAHARPVDSACLLAHLLLSLAPVHQNVRGARPEAIDVLGRVYEQGSRLGLEMLSVKALSRQDNWGEEWYQHLVQRCLLWETTKARYSLMKMFSCPSITDLPLPNVHLFPSTAPSEAVGATLQYLRRLHQLIRLAKPVAQGLHDLEQQSIDTCPDLGLLAGIGDLWKALNHDVVNVQRAWKLKNDLLFYDTHLVVLWFLLRVSIFLQRLHFPLSPEITFQGVLFSGAAFRQGATQVIDLILSMPASPSEGPTLAQMPQYVIKLLTFMIASARRAVQYLAEWHPHLRDAYLDEGKLEACEKQLEGLGGDVGDLFSDLRQRRIEAEILAEAPRAHGKGEGANGLPTADLGGALAPAPGLGLGLGPEGDWLNFDFDAWLASSDPLFGQMPVS